MTRSRHVFDEGWWRRRYDFLGVRCLHFWFRSVFGATTDTAGVFCYLSSGIVVWVWVK